MRLLLFYNLDSSWKNKYKYSFLFLPFALMAASFIPLRFGMYWLAPKFHVSMTARGQHLGVFDVIALTAMVVLMVSGYVLGFLANAMILYFVFGWSVPKLKDLFLRSIIPEHWYK